MSDRFRRLEKDQYDAIVVGSGAGGLTAAALLARKGLEVLVLDQHYVAGGNATIFRRPGYEFDVGIHYIGECSPNGQIARILRAAGAGNVAFEEMDPDGFDTLVFPDFTFRVPRGIERFRARLHERFPSERKGIDRYLTLVQQVQDFGKLPGKRKSPLGALRTLSRSGMLMRWANRTFDDFLDTCTRDARLRAVLAGQNGDYGQPPSRVPAAMGAGLAAHYLGGAYFPRGGGQVIADALAESIEREGGKLLLRTKVERIVVERGRVQGVELVNKHVGRRIVRAPVVLSNADLKQTVSKLVGPEHLKRKTVRQTERFEMSPALGVVYLGLKRDLAAEGHPRTNYWIYPGYDYDPIYRDVREGRFPEVPGCYVTVASLKDPTSTRLAPEGVTNVQLMSIVPSAPAAWGLTEAEVRDGTYGDSERYAQAKERYARSLFEVADQVIPGIADDVVYQEVASPFTHTRFTGSSNGTSYGISLVTEQFLGKRPGARTEIDGLYLCGASTRSGHGIGGVTMSGLVAASSVLGGGLVRRVLGPENEVDETVAASAPSPAPAAPPMVEDEAA